MRALAGSLVLLACFCTPARGQTSAGGAIRGVAKDAQGAAVPGVMVTAAGTTIPTRRTAVTDARGQYVLSDLPPGDYAVAAELTGFARFRRADVVVRAGLTIDVDVLMTVGAVDETVEVRADTPLLDTRRAGQAVNVSGELLRSVPLLEKREWFGAIAVAPGVTSAEWVNNERLFSVHGADAGANVVQIDGADVTPATGSAILHVGLGTEAVDDIQIKTSGTDASSPLGLGGIVNVATVSGTNRLRGAATLTLQPRDWNGSNNPGGTSSTVDQRQTEASLGAPLVRDRLWAFGSYRYADVTSGVSRTAAQLDALRALIPGFAPFDSRNESQFVLAKVTAQLSPRHDLMGLYQYDGNPTRVADPTGASAFPERVGGSGALARLSSAWSSRFTSRIAASYNDKRRDNLRPDADAPFQPIYQSTFLSAGLPVGNGLLVNRGSPTTALQRQPNSKLTLSIDTTLVLDSRIGSHQLESGIYIQPRTTIGRTVSYLNGGFVQEDLVLRRPGDLASGVAPFHRVVIDQTEVAAARVRGSDYAAYVQDAWRPLPRLTLNAGLRIDRVTWRDRLFDVTSVSSLEIGPRAGVNYAVTSDSRTVARAHWVRVHDRPTQVATSVGSTTPGQRDFYDADLDGTFETVLTTPSVFALTAGRTFDPRLHVPFIDEWGAGLTRQLPGRLSLGLDVVRREYEDRPALIETNGVYDGSRFVGYRDEAFNATYLVTNNRWNRPVYTSTEVSVTKRTNRIQAIGSYVRQWRHLAGTWQPNDPALFIQPAAFANDRGIGSATGVLSTPTDANSLSGTQMTQRATASGQWQDHAVRLGAAWSAPFSVLAAASVTYQSGAWSGPIVTRLAAADPAFGPSTVTLANGRVVANPLATTIRFAYPTRGDGQVRTPAFHVLNLRVGRRFTIRAVKVEAALDVFNATNHDADLGFQSGANQQYNPLFGQTTFRQLPRSAQVYVRCAF